MSYKFFAITVLAFASSLAACSETSEKKPKADAYVTNAEYVLDILETKNATAVAFQVKPMNQAACEHMYIELGKKDSEGTWQVSNQLFPGKDKRDSFGQFALRNEIHFAEIDAEGEFGVISLGCKAKGERLRVIQGLHATFDVTPEKLNYIGEIALVPVGNKDRGFFTVEISDRAEFALQQIQAQLPALKPHFYPSIMEKHVQDIPPDLRADLEALNTINRKRTEDFNQLKALRNKLIDEAAMAKLDFEMWKNENGQSRKNLSAAKKKTYDQLSDNFYAVRVKINKFDLWVRHGKSFQVVQKYMALEAEEQKIRKSLYTKFPLKTYSEMSEAERNNPERLRLNEVLSKAQDARTAYEKQHGLD